MDHRAGTERLKNPPARLPDLVLPAAADGAMREIRGSGRRSPVLVVVDSPDCSRCREYVRLLERHSGEIDDWDGDVKVILPGPSREGTESPTSPGSAFRVLLDVAHHAAARLRVNPPAVVIADRWGEIRALEPAGEPHDFLPPDEVVQWLRFLAIECPECQGEAY